MVAERVYVDADILIWHLRGLDVARQLMASLLVGGSELWTSAVQRIEVQFHSRPAELAAVRELWRVVQTHLLTEEILDLGAELYQHWHPSHGTGENDALLAATVMITGGRLVTQNLRHFPMPGLLVDRGW